MLFLPQSIYSPIITATKYHLMFAANLDSALKGYGTYSCFSTTSVYPCNFFFLSNSYASRFGLNFQSFLFHLKTDFSFREGLFCFVFHFFLHSSCEVGFKTLGIMRVVITMDLRQRRISSGSRYQWVRRSLSLRTTLNKHGGIWLLYCSLLILCHFIALLMTIELGV